MADEETKETPKIGTYEYAIRQGATEEQAREYVVREAARDSEYEDDDGVPAVRYFIHSGVRKRHTRLLRMKSPVHHDLVQRIGGLVVRRTRPVHVSVDKIREILPDLMKAQAEGRLELRTHDGRLVDLVTGEALYKHPMPSKPLPNPLLDSAARDKPAGMHYPAYQEGVALGAVARRPSVLPEDEVDEDDDEDTGSIPPGNPSVPPPPPPPVPPVEPPAPVPAPDAPAPVEPTAAVTAEPVAPAADPEAAVTTNPEGETLEAEGETTEAEGETAEPSDETTTPSEAPPSKGPPLPKVTRGKHRGRS